MSWNTAKEKFEYFEFPKDKFLENIKKYEEQETIITKGNDEEIKALKEKGMVTANKSFYTAKGNKKPNIKYTVVNLCDLDGYEMNVWETKNEDNIIERGWAMFNEDDNVCMITKKEYSFKKSDINTDFFETERKLLK